MRDGMILTLLLVSPNSASLTDGAERSLAVSSLELPEIGTQVVLNGEQMCFVGQTEEHVILHRNGRNKSFAAICQPVTAARLSAEYASTTVHINGKPELRYFLVKDPVAGAFFRFDTPDGKTVLWPDYACAVLFKSTLICTEQKSNGAA